MRLISGLGAAIIAVIGVLDLVVALLIVLVIAVVIGVRLFRRAMVIDQTFKEILHKQNQQRLILMSGRQEPRPLPRPR